MKNKVLSAAICFLISLAQSAAAPLPATTAVHTKPDAAAPSFTYLKAGAEPAPAADTLQNTPAGWMAVEINGPFQGYVQSTDFTKDLTVKPGAAIRLAPKSDAPVLAVAKQGDKTTITGLHGSWDQVSLAGPVVGYIRVGGVPGYLPPIATTPAGGTPPPPNPEPATRAVYGASSAGQPAPVAGANDSANPLPRRFAGTFVSTRTLFHPRRPYDWALDDNAGQRVAYLDLSKLLETDQPDKYVGHRVEVFGPPKPTPDGKDIVIQVESLKLGLER